MTWKYENSNKIVKIDRSFRRFNGKLNPDRHLIIPFYVVKYLEEQLQIPDLIQNCELVVELKGMMLPPNQWIKIEEK